MIDKINNQFVLWFRELKGVHYFLLSMIFAGILLRFYTLLFFEFKYDQALALSAADEVVKQKFLISHGMVSGVKIVNPPGFYYLMGIFSFFASSPSSYALIFVFFSIIALLALIYLMKDFISLEENLSLAALLALTPSLIVYSSNIWAQSLIPFFAVIVFSMLARFIILGREMTWVYAFWVNALAASIHLSGFFIFPFTIYCAYARGIKFRKILAGVLPTVLFFLPYLVYMLGHQNLGSISYTSSCFWQNIPRIFANFANFYSYSFFRYYFDNDYFAVSSYFLSKAGIVIAIVSSFAIKTAIFAGFAFSIYAISKSKGLFMAGDDRRFTIIKLSGLQVVCVLFGYMIANIWTYPHYFLVTVPAGAVLIIFRLGHMSYALNGNIGDYFLQGKYPPQ